VRPLSEPQSGRLLAVIPHDNNKAYGQDVYFFCRGGNASGNLPPILAAGGVLVAKTLRGEKKGKGTRKQSHILPGGAAGGECGYRAQTPKEIEKTEEGKI